MLGLLAGLSYLDQFTNMSAKSGHCVASLLTNAYHCAILFYHSSSLQGQWSCLHSDIIHLSTELS